MSGMDKLASSLYSALTESDKKKPKPYDTKAEVLRTEGNTVWVKIPGGIDETPVQRTNNANPGDTVMVRVAGGRAWLLGNNTSPATDDTKANIAYAVANDAGYTAETAIQNAISAQDSASIAKIAADAATEDAAIARDNAQEAIEATTTIRTLAQDAYDNAGIAQTSAAIATSSANTALDQLGIVENVVGVLEMLQTHGDYQITTDHTVEPNKWYFRRSGEYPNYIYSVVNNPASIEYAPTTDTSVESGKIYYSRSGTGTGDDPYVYTAVEPVGTEDPSDEGWYECIFYELTGIKEEIQNYIANQLVVDDQGLWLKRPDFTGIQTKVLLSQEYGVVLYDETGHQVGQYGSTAVVGDPQHMHITMTGTRLSFYDAQQEVAYIDGQKLYIKQTIVLEQMDLGETIPKGGNGQWSWKIHPNANGKNNLNLKWVG